VSDSGGALFNIGVTFIVHRHALVDLVEMYAQAEEGESEITQASPSTGHILPGPLPAGEIADGVGGEGKSDSGPDVENSLIHYLVPWSQWVGCYEVIQLGMCRRIAAMCMYGFGSASGGVSFLILTQ